MIKKYLNFNIINMLSLYPPKYSKNTKNTFDQDYKTYISFLLNIKNLQNLNNEDFDSFILNIKDDINKNKNINFDKINTLVNIKKNVY